MEGVGSDAAAAPEAAAVKRVHWIYQPEFRSAEGLLEALGRAGPGLVSAVAVAPYVNEGVGDKARRVPTRLVLQGGDVEVAEAVRLLGWLDAPRPSVAVSLTVAEVRSVGRRERGGLLRFDRDAVPGAPGTIFRGTAGTFEPESYLRSQLTGVVPFQGTSLAWGDLDPSGGLFEHVLRALSMRQGAEMVARTTLVATEAEPCRLASLVKLPAALLVQAGTNPVIASTPLDAGFTLELEAVRVGRDTAELKLKVHLASAEPDPAPDAIAGAMVMRARELVTRLVVRDGETQVLGGLYLKRHLGDRRGMPLLDQLPALDVLVSADGRSAQETELLFVLTPRLLGVRPEPVEPPPGR